MTTHTDLIARLREGDFTASEILEAANALESLEQQVAALTRAVDTDYEQLYREANDQLAALTETNKMRTTQLSQVTLELRRMQAGTLVEDLKEQVAAMNAKTLELDEAWSNCSMYKQQVLNAQADNARLRKQLIRVVGDHNPPRDCYATGPMTGNEIEDLVSCPSCEAEVLLAIPTDDSALIERLKQEREWCAERLEAVDGEWITKVAASALIRSMT